MISGNVDSIKKLIRMVSHSLRSAMLIISSLLLHSIVAVTSGVIDERMIIPN